MPGIMPPPTLARLAGSLQIWMDTHLRNTIQWPPEFV